MFDLFFLFGFWLPAFWLAVLVFCTIADSIESPEFRFLAIAAGIGIGITCWITHTNPLTWVSEHPVLLITYSVGYLVLGTFWSMFKWDRFAAKRAVEFQEALKEYNEEYAAWVKTKENPKSTMNGLTKITTKYPEPHKPTREKFQPQVLQNKRKFSAWIIVWADLAIAIRDQILKTFGKLYERIATRHFKETA
jgi:hypothetical protein